MRFEKELSGWENGPKHNPIWVNSPARINLIGEHTDYNYGFVLPAAIDKTAYFLIQLREDNHCKVEAKDVGDYLIFDFQDDLKPSPKNWQNYFLGVMHYMKGSGKVKQGFNLVFESDIPTGAGMSSSAALACGFGMAINEAYQLGLSKQEIAEIAQLAEHHFVGVKCGIMDQFASVMSKESHVILLDCQSLDYEYIPIQIKPYKIFEKDDIKIGVFGLGIELEGLVDTRNYKETIYLNPIEIAQDMSRILKEDENCDLVICLSHLGYHYKNETNKKYLLYWCWLCRRSYNVGYCTKKSRHQSNRCRFKYPAYRRLE